MEDVMNNTDLRREIWSYLRKNPELSCIKCNSVCIWDKKVKRYLFIPNMKNITKSAYCIDCWNKLNKNLIKYRKKANLFSCCLK